MPLVVAPKPDEAGQHLWSAPATLANPGQQLADEYLSSSAQEMYLAPFAAPNVQRLAWTWSQFCEPARQSFNTM